MIRSTSCPWNPTSVNFVASTCSSHFTPAVEQPGMHHHKKNESHKRDNTKRPETASKQRLQHQNRTRTEEGSTQTNAACVCGVYTGKISPNATPAYRIYEAHHCNTCVCMYVASGGEEKVFCLQQSSWTN